MTATRTLTLDALKEFGDDINKALTYANSFKPAYKKSPSKPLLNNVSRLTSKEVIEYGSVLAQYEKELEEYKLTEVLDRSIRNSIDNIIVEFIKYEAGLDNIPMQYRDKVYSYAYSKGHSYGHHEIYNELVQLIEIF